MYHSYTGKDQKRVAINQLIGILCLIFTAPLYLSVFMSMFFIPTTNPDYIFIPCWGIALFLFSFSLVSFYINYYPTIWTNDEGLFLSYFSLFRLKINWKDVIDMSERKWLFDSVILVRARKITPFHILYSLFFSGSLYPGFLFMNSIQNGSELINEIRQKVQPYSL